MYFQLREAILTATGNVSADNKKSLTSLHKFCTPGIKLSTFIKNISSLSIYSSYHIWLCRNDPVFVCQSYLPAPFMWFIFDLTSSLGTWLLQVSPVCGPSWIYPWQPTIWVVPCRKPVYYQMLCFEINLNTVGFRAMSRRIWKLCVASLLIILCFPGPG